MKKGIAMLVIVALLWGFAMAETSAPTAQGMETQSPAIAATQDEKAIISATGSARALLTADIAVLTIGVRATGNNVMEAQDSADATITNLREILASMGIAQEEIQPTFYSVQTTYSYQYSKLGEQETPTGYSVSTDMVVRVREIDRVGEVIDAAIQGGADSNYELTFESSMHDEAYDGALQDALADAMKKAELLAKGSGLKLGKLRSVTELTDARDASGISGAAANESGVIPLHSELSVFTSVQVCYEAE